MKKFKNYVLAAAGVVALALTITLMNTNHAGAQQAVTPQAIAPPPQKPPKPPAQVEVVNPVLPVFDVDNARQPFQPNSAVLSFKPCNQSANRLDTKIIATVPNDKRLVIEYISGIGELDGNNFFTGAHVNTTVSGATEQHYLVVNRLGNTNVATFFALSQQARLYADPGTTVDVTGTIAVCGLGNFVVTISGYLVDVSQFEFVDQQ